MNAPMPPPPDDEPTREERELGALYRRLPRAEPDASLDARVLAEARRAVASSPRLHSPRWLVGLGTAAVLVLAVGVTWHLKPMREPMREPTQQQTAPTPAAETRAQTDSFDEPAPPPSGAGTMERKRELLPKSSMSIGNLAARATSASPTAQSAPREDKKTEARQALAGRRAGNIAREADDAVAAKPQTAHAAPLAPAASMQSAPPAPASPPAQPMKETTAPNMAGASKRAATPEPTAQALVDAARKALRRGDSNGARKQVLILLHDYPQFTLPADLAPLAPARDRDMRDP